MRTTAVPGLFPLLPRPPRLRAGRAGGSQARDSPRAGRMLHRSNTSPPSRRKTPAASWTSPCATKWKASSAAN